MQEEQAIRNAPVCPSEGPGIVLTGAGEEFIARDCEARQKRSQGPLRAFGFYGLHKETHPWDHQGVKYAAGRETNNAQRNQRSSQNLESLAAYGAAGDQGADALLRPGQEDGRHGGPGQQRYGRAGAVRPHHPCALQLGPCLRAGGGSGLGLVVLRQRQHHDRHDKRRRAAYVRTGQNEAAEAVHIGLTKK